MPAASSRQPNNAARQSRLVASQREARHPIVGSTKSIRTCLSRPSELSLAKSLKALGLDDIRAIQAGKANR